MKMSTASLRSLTGDLITLMKVFFSNFHVAISKINIYYEYKCLVQKLYDSISSS